MQISTRRKFFTHKQIHLQILMISSSVSPPKTISHSKRHQRSQSNSFPGIIWSWELLSVSLFLSFLSFMMVLCALISINQRSGWTLEKSHGSYRDCSVEFRAGNLVVRDADSASVKNAHIANMLHSTPGCLIMVGSDLPDG